MVEGWAFRKDEGMMEKRYYAAYGSNLNVHQMRMRCPDAKIIGTAEIPDYRLLFKGSSSSAYLTVEPQEGKTVPVGIWAVSSRDEERLDRYEGFPRVYYKTAMVLPITGIRTGKVRNRTVFLYIMHEEKSLGMPSWYYLNTCWEGYKAFGFNPEHIAEAFHTSLEGSIYEA